MTNRFAPFVLSVFLLGLTGSTAGAQDTVNRQALPPQRDFAIENVSVLPMDSNRVLAAQTVQISNGRIASISATAATSLPADMMRVDGSGKFLMPGLAEMHSHVPSPTSTVGHNTLFLYLANGITTMRGMQGSNAHVALRDQINSGEVLGPRFFAAGPQLSPASARTPQAGVENVRRQKEMRFDLLKIQEGLAPDVYDSIAATAKALGIPFAGHVPNDVGLFRAIDAGQTTIDHLDNYMETILAPDFPADRLALAPARPGEDETGRRIRALAEVTKRAGVAVVPTMALWEVLYCTPDSAAVAGRPELKYMPGFNLTGWYTTLAQGPRIAPNEQAAWIALRNRILKGLSDAGVTVLLGTDSPQLFSVPGFSIHREMTSMSEAGMSNWEILRSGTWNVAEFLGLSAESGSVAVGKRADLLLLNSNPLVSLANAQDRAGIVVDGRWLPEAEIQERLAAIVRGYSGGN